MSAPSLKRRRIRSWCRLLRAKRQVSKAIDTKIKIHSTFEHYRAVSKRGALLYFVVADLSAVDPMYQYSLQFFVNLFKSAMDRAPMSEEVAECVQIMISVITEDVYTQVCAGSLRKTDELELPPTPVEDLISNVVLAALTNLQVLPGFEGLLHSFVADTELWRKWCSSDTPEDLALPAPWHAKLSAFQCLLVLRVVCDEKIVSALTMFILNGAAHAHHICLADWCGPDDLSPEHCL